MNMKQMGALFKREITDILRDKKTLIMMILIPLVLYPLLIVGITLVSNAMISSQEEKTYRIAFQESVPSEMESSIEELIEESTGELDYKLSIVDSADCEADLMAEEIDVYVSMKGEKVIINYLSAEEASATAEYTLRDVFDMYKENLTRELIAAEGLDVEAVLNPVTVETEDFSSTEESIGSMLGSMMPFLIITVILLGAIYPAIDVTAGEKERGTLETLLTLPVTNFEMIMSKFLAVSCIACASAILNVFSMAGAMAFLVTSSISAVSDMTINFESFIPGILFTIVVMLFFALLVTAVSMCTCVFAKSFKDANNYITPVMLVFMFASYAPMLPDLELTAMTAAIPAVNVALMVEGLFQFHYNYGLFAIVLFSNVAYSLLAIMVLGKIYNSEAVLFSEGFTSVKLFSKRSEMKEKQMPGFGDMILLLCVVLLLIFYVGTYAQLQWGFGGVVVQQVIILICPLIYAWYMKADAGKLFSLEKIKPLKLIGSLCIGVAAFLGATVIGALLAPVFPESAQSLAQMDEMLAGQSTGILILVIALMPAIGEELLFRGFVMGTLRNKCKPVTAVVVTTLIFAAYHMSLIKMFTISIVGLGLTLAAYKTGSIAASMCVHFMNNLLSVLVTKHPEQMEKIFPVLFKESLGATDMVILLVIIIVSAALGWILISRGSAEKVKDEK